MILEMDDMNLMLALNAAQMRRDIAEAAYRRVMGRRVISRASETVSRQPHKLETVGSTPTLANAPDDTPPAPFCITSSTRSGDVKGRVAPNTKYPPTYAEMPFTPPAGAFVCGLGEPPRQLQGGIDCYTTYTPPAPSRPATSTLTELPGLAAPNEPSGIAG